MRTRASTSSSPFSDDASRGSPNRGQRGACPSHRRGGSALSAGRSIGATVGGRHPNTSRESTRAGCFASGAPGGGGGHALSSRELSYGRSGGANASDRTRQRRSAGREKRLESSRDDRFDRSVSEGADVRLQRVWSGGRPTRDLLPGRRLPWYPAGRHRRADRRRVHNRPVGRQRAEGPVGRRTPAASVV